MNEDYSVAGQPSADDLKHAAESGFKSVLNLRSPDEANTLPDEQQQAKSAGLRYVNLPLNSSVPDEALVNKALTELEELSKPVLIHCGAGLRAGAIALIATARDLQWTLEQLTEKANEVGLSLEQPHLKQFIKENYRESD